MSENPMDQSGNALAEEDLCIRVEALNAKHCLHERVQKLRSFFCRQFGGQQPVFFVKIPGRVNIIGEHVDYCGYPVLPMAIDQCILLAVGYTDDDDASEAQLKLRNVQSEKFIDYDCDLKALSIELPCKGFADWFKYYLCGVKGIYETFGEVIARPTGMCVALDGNVPPAAGLSSSSALVSAAALATAHVHGLPLERKQLAALSARCERYIGTQGGGMDQAIAYLAKAGFAQFIEFEPQLCATPVQLPSGVCFVVANSLAEKNKAASSDFNERVVECRLACHVLAKQANLKNWRQVRRFAQLQEALQCSLGDLAALVHKEFATESGDAVTRAQVCDSLGIDEQELERDFLTANTLHMSTFKLYARSLHVVQESMRVLQFQAICNRVGHPAHHTAKDLATLGDLMRASHNSLRCLYECSHPDLDRLIEIAEATGVGARLTGAGWGGCIVALCESPAASADFIRLLKEKYYAQLPVHLLERHQANDFADLVFATLPGHGAQIFAMPP